HRARHPLQQLAKPFVQPLICKTAAIKLVIKPNASRYVHGTAPPRFGARQGIMGDSCRARYHSSTRPEKIWVIESFTGGYAHNAGTPVGRTDVRHWPRTGDSRVR